MDKSSLTILIYAVPVITTLSALACFIVLLRQRQSKPELKWFLLYTGFYFLMTIITFCLNRFSIDNHRAIVIGQNLSNLTVLIELSIYGVYFRRLFKPVQNKIIVALAVGFTIIFCILTINNLRGNIAQGQITLLYIIESLILITGCFFYYYNLFDSIPVEKLKQLSSFWITTGLLFLKIGLLPVFLSQQFFTRLYMEYSFVLFFLYSIYTTINFLVILKASICKPTREISSSLSL